MAFLRKEVVDEAHALVSLAVALLHKLCIKSPSLCLASHCTKTFAFVDKETYFDKILVGTTQQPRNALVQHHLGPKPQKLLSVCDSMTS
jgi:hypothetical protein